MQRINEVADTFSVILCDPGEKIDFRNGPRVVEGRLSEAYILPDGAINDEPSLCFVIDLIGGRVVGQLSVNMFKAVMDEVVPLIKCGECGAIKSKCDPCVCPPR